MKRALPHPRGADGDSAGVRLVSGAGGSAYERTQGDVYRIFYYHVPSAWTAFLLFFINFIASIQYLVQRETVDAKAAKVDCDRNRSRRSNCKFSAAGAAQCFQRACGRAPIATTVLAIPGILFLDWATFPGIKLDVLAVTTAEVGVVFCTIVLVTGPIWARPVWGIWWDMETSG